MRRFGFVCFFMFDCFLFPAGCWRPAERVFVKDGFTAISKDVSNHIALAGAASLWGITRPNLLEDADATGEIDPQQESAAAAECAVERIEGRKAGHDTRDGANQSEAFQRQPPPVVGR